MAGGGWIIPLIVLAAALAGGIVVFLRGGSPKGKAADAESKAKPASSKGTGACPALCVGRSQTIGSRSDQEDSLCYSDWHDAGEIAKYGFLAAVADGIGGLDDGQVASQAAMRVMRARFKELPPTMKASDRLLELAACAHKEVRRVNQEGVRSGTTLVSVLICGWDLWLLSVGDSRIYLYRSGTLLLLNRMHTFGKQVEEKRSLTGTGTPPDDKRGRALTAYLGQDNLSTMDRTTQPMRLVPGDQILLMSDGVFGTLNEDEIAAKLTGDPDASATAIIAAVEAKGKQSQDNASVVIISIS